MCKARTVPPGAPLSVAVDATPLLGVVSGVGRFCAGALGALGARRDLDVSAYAVSWRRRGHIVPLLPAGVAARQRAMPARPLQAAWERFDTPPAEWFVGRVDVVHGTNYVVPPTTRAAAVVTVHDLTVVRFPEMCDAATLRFPQLVRRALARGAWVHTHSRFVADEVVEHFGADPAMVVPVAPGIPALGGDATAPGAPLVLPPGCDRYLLAIGTVEPRKDYPGLLDAFAVVGATRPELALVIVGADGWGSEAFREALASSPLRDRVLQPGYLSDEDLGAALAGAAALVYPSRYEGFGLPPLQAMALGVPVVATAAGAVPEVVGDAAEMVEPGDADALAGAITAVVDDPGRAAALAEAGRRQADRFSWEACGAGLAELYHQAAAS